MNEPPFETLTGGCLCGGIRYRITGPRRDVINCHCENCRRTHGHIAAYTSVLQSDLDLIEAQSLQWYHDESPDTYRGFCNRCGASLFWDRLESDAISVAAGTLDEPSGLATAAEIFVADKGDYYELAEGHTTYPGSLSA